MHCRPAISSHSLGRAWVHELQPKLDVAARYGLDIEMFYEDLEYFAQSVYGNKAAASLVKAARKIRCMCNERGISIVCLQPFMHYEGLRDRQCHQRRVEEFQLWIQIAKALHTSIIAIPSTSLSKQEVSGDLDLIVNDLRQVADLAGVEGIEVAYESLAWGTYADTWEDAWKVVETVDRPNFGICLDTFNMAARVYADPVTASGLNQNAEEAMKRSLGRLVRTIDPKKIAWVQVVDAQHLKEPLVKGHQYYSPRQPARMSWSRNCRLFYGEQHLGGYLPIKAILQAILVDLGFEGWVSAELFNVSLTDDNPAVPEQHAQRAATSWQCIVDDFRLDAKTVHSKRDSGLMHISGHTARAQL